MELSILKSFALGIVQGFTEFLPISSTAHLILSAKILQLELNSFLKSFIIIIQFGSILAIIILYWRKVWDNHIVYFKKILTAFIPTAIIGLLFYKIVKNVFQENIEIISLALFLGGVAIIILERKYREKQGSDSDDSKKINNINDISYKQCFIIGLFQSLAMVPGVSRSAATILGGLSLGVGRLAIVEFSFLLAIPTMLAASSFDLLKSGIKYNSSEVILLIIGFVTSFIIAWFSVHFLLEFIRKNSFILFGWYRVFLGVVLFLFLYIF